MTRQRTTASTPLTTIAPFWPIDDASLERVQRAYRAWFETSEEMQRQALEYVNERIAKDSAMLVDMTKCATPLDVLNLQTSYTREAYEDLVDNGRRIAGLLDDAAKNTFARGTQ